MYSSLRCNLLILSLLGAASTVFPAVTEAQEPLRVAAELEQSQAVNQAKRQATITANVEFTAEEMGKFWPLYWEYRTMVNKVDDAYIRIIQEYSKSYLSMGNRKAEKLTDAWLQVEFDRYDLKKRYSEKFNEALPAAKTLRVMQIEHKLDVMLAASVAKQAPLVVPDS